MKPGVKGPNVRLAGVLVVAALATALLVGCGGQEPSSTTAPSVTVSTAGSSTETAAPSSTTSTAATTTTTLSQGDTGVAYPDIVYNTLKGLGKGKVDVEAWKTTRAAELSIEWARDSFLYKNEMDTAVLAHWEARGIKKEMHDADDPVRKWASYTPLAALEAGNDKKYPVIFDFVGAERLIFSAEGHGIAYLAAEKGYIAVLPSNPVAVAFAGETVDITPAEQVLRILDALEAGGYPVDRSRVYVVGMSAGGVATSKAGLALPDVVAAVAIHSALPVISTSEGAWSFPGAWTPPADYEKAAEYGLPMLAICGDQDMAMMPISRESIVDGLNHWLAVNDCPTRVSWQECLKAQETSTDAAVKAIGLVGDKMWTSTINGVVHHGAEFYRSDGVKVVELVCVTNLPHFPSASFPELAWEFMSRFSRDANGKLVVTQ